MNHNKKAKKLNRTSSHRKALLKNITIPLIMHGQIKTTVAIAKFCKPEIEKLITLMKNNNLANFRKALSLLNNNSETVKKLLEVSKQNASRPGGYIRIIKSGYRFGDCAPVAIMEFVDYPEAA